MNCKKVLVLGILAATIIVIIGIAWQSNYTYFWFQEPISYYFDEGSVSIPSAVTLDVDFETGFTWIQFEENASLVYRIEMTTTRFTIQNHGSPFVEYADNEIDLAYPSADATITLGTGTNYTIDVRNAIGKIFIIIDNGPNIGNIDLNSNTADIELRMANSTILNENVTINIDSYSGSVDVFTVLPYGIGGSFQATIIDVGVIDITAPTWTEISSNYYVSSNYYSANTTITFLVYVHVGTILAELE